MSLDTQVRGRYDPSIPKRGQQTVFHHPSRSQARPFDTTNDTKNEESKNDESKTDEFKTDEFKTNDNANNDGPDNSTFST